MYKHVTWHIICVLTSHTTQTVSVWLSSADQSTLPQRFFPISLTSTSSTMAGMYTVVLTIVIRILLDNLEQFQNVLLSVRTQCTPLTTLVIPLAVDTCSSNNARFTHTKLNGIANNTTTLVYWRFVCCGLCTGYK